MDEHKLLICMYGCFVSVCVCGRYREAYMYVGTIVAFAKNTRAVQSYRTHMNGETVNFPVCRLSCVCSCLCVSRIGVERFLRTLSRVSALYCLLARIVCWFLVHNITQRQLCVAANQEVNYNLIWFDWRNIWLWNALCVLCACVLCVFVVFVLLSIRHIDCDGMRE